MLTNPLSSRPDFTFKHNQTQNRHGWLRLTPAYSVKLVTEILNNHADATSIVDPFSGTGTTGLVAAERGQHCDLLDINPFLIWFGTVKTKSYTQAEIIDFADAIIAVIEAYHQQTTEEIFWTPDIQNIDRWWQPYQKIFLARLYAAINSVNTSDVARDLLKIGFCQRVIELSNAAFNHQSMSFKHEIVPQLFDTADTFLQDYEEAWRKILHSVTAPLTGPIKLYLRDSRQIEMSENTYDLVITSPPYPNRMSYIRELRPYMYWLGFIHEAGELDWQAIGGTWGIATSRVSKWEGEVSDIAFAKFPTIVKAIDAHSPVLSRYVHKYFDDITQHLRSLYPCVKPGGSVYYVVGNSKFYDTMLPVQDIYASLLRAVGFCDVKVEILRKRNSKKELYEYVVSAKKSAVTG